MAYRGEREEAFIGDNSLPSGESGGAGKFVENRSGFGEAGLMQSSFFYDGQGGVNSAMQNTLWSPRARATEKLTVQEVNFS